MKNVIIGTAGHIDHGKTTLIRALTGHNTDRLKEEQKRGISIDLGFTFFDLPSGIRAGIIDVPGHEKFIKNMLAGVVGMDVVILLVAADEGMMPQTIEHMEILNLLGIKNGLIALTKIDMVDEDWLELIIEDTKERTKGTFLEDKPIIPVSSVNGEGIDELKNEIDKIISEISEENSESDLPRLPIDRSFSISGHGTVVTGTLISGSLKVNDEVQVFPSDTVTRIRSLQVHDSDVDKAYRGQRVAVNLAGLKKEDAPRGSMLAPVASMKASRILDIKLKTIDLSFDLTNRTRLRLYIGTQEVFGRIILLEKEVLSSREETVAQILLEEDVVARKGDRFIVRLFSPMITVGGGEVIDANPSRKKRFNEEDIELVKLMGAGDAKDVTEAVIGENSKHFPSLNEIAKLESKSLDEVDSYVEALEEEGKVYVIKMTNDSYVIHKKFADDLISKITSEVEAFHKAYPLRAGMVKEQIRSKYFKEANKKVGELFLDVIINNSKLDDMGSYLKHQDFKIILNDEHKRMKSDIIEEYSKEFLASPNIIQELSAKYRSNTKDLEEVFKSMISSGELYILQNDMVLKTDELSKAKKSIIAYLKENDIIGLAETRDLLNTNRKTALAILEDMDREGLTKRTDDGRKLI